MAATMSNVSVPGSALAGGAGQVACWQPGTLPPPPVVAASGVPPPCGVLPPPCTSKPATKQLDARATLTPAPSAAKARTSGKRMHRAYEVAADGAKEADVPMDGAPPL